LLVLSIFKTFCQTDSYCSVFFLYWCGDWRFHRGGFITTKLNFCQSGEKGGWKTFWLQPGNWEEAIAEQPNANMGLESSQMAVRDNFDNKNPSYTI
jgi:hypothetical protein